MPTLKEQVGSRIKHLRETHGLSLKQLATAVGSSEPTLIRIEKGRSATDLDTLERLAHQLGVTPTDLLSAPKPRAASTDPAIRAIAGEIAELLATVDESKLPDILNFTRLWAAGNRKQDTELGEKGG